MARNAALKFAKVDESSSGDNSIVTAVSGHHIQVVSYVLVAASAVSVKWRSGTTDLCGAMSLAANGGVVATTEPVTPFFQTASGEALNLNLGSAVQVSGHISYVVEPD